MGPDTGWDSIGVPQDAFKMSKFLSALDSTDQLAKTILYNLNPADNEMMITMAGNFNDGYPAESSVWSCMVVPRSEKRNGEAPQDLASLGTVKKVYRNGD